MCTCMRISCVLSQYRHMYACIRTSCVLSRSQRCCSCCVPSYKRKQPSAHTAMSNGMSVDDRQVCAGTLPHITGCRSTSSASGKLR